MGDPGSSIPSDCHVVKKVLQKPILSEGKKRNRIGVFDGGDLITRDSFCFIDPLRRDIRSEIDALERTLSAPGTAASSASHFFP